MTRRSVVTIALKDGVAEVHRAPAGVDVHIVDFDVDPDAKFPEQEAALPKRLTVMGRQARLYKSRSQANACFLCGVKIPYGELNYVAEKQSRLHFCLECVEKGKAQDNAPLGENLDQEGWSGYGSE